MACGNALRILAPTGIALLVMIAAGTGGPAAAAATATGEARAERSVRSIPIDTGEGTWMSVDVAPDGETVVFDLLGDVYVLSRGNARARRLTHARVAGDLAVRGSAYDAQPRFSPDGRHIAFVSDRSGSDNLWVMDADGSDPRQITRERGVVFSSPAWSPDGEHLAVARSEDARAYEIWSYSVDGGSEGRELLGSDRQVDYRGPAFAPDGDSLYVAIPFDSTSDRPLRRQTWQIGRLDLDSGELRQVTRREGGAVRPQVSPDGTRLSYATWHRQSPALVVRDLQGGDERVVVDGVSRNLQDMYLSQLDLFPGYTFGPDGEVLYLSRDGRIHRVELESGVGSRVPMRVRTRLSVPERPGPEGRVPGSRTSRMIRWPAVDVTGERVYFEAVGRIWVRSIAEEDADDSARALTPPSLLAVQPSLSPDGGSIAFVGTSSDDKAGHVYRLDTANGDITRLTQRAGDFARPVWSPEGERLVVVKGRPGDRSLARRSLPRQQLAWLDASGGEPEPFADLRIGDAGVRFSADGERLWYTAEGRLRSIGTDGEDRRTHLRVPGARQIVPAPGGDRVAVSLDNRVVVRAWDALEQGGAQATAASTVPVTARDVAGYFPTWNDSGELFQAFAGSLVRRTGTTAREGDAAAADVTGQWPLRVRTRTGERDADGILALTGGRVITMADRGVVEQGTVIIRGGRITRVGPVDRVKIPQAASVIDTTGKTLMPGLIDVHQHALFLQGADTLQNPQTPFPPASALLAFGVTTTRDPALISNLRDFSMIELINSGRIPGPRYLATGERIRPGAYPLTSLGDAGAAIDLQARLGASYIKEYLQPRRRQRQWLAEAAFRQPIAITFDTGFSYKRAVTAMLDGYTATEHSAGNVAIHDDFAQLVARTGTFYTPTILSQVGAQYYFERHDVVGNEKLRRHFPQRLLQYLARRERRGKGVPTQETAFPTLTRNLERLEAAGATIGVGAHDQPAPTGLGTHWEIWSFVAGGLTPREALKAATRDGARILGIEDRVGSLARGKRADLLVLGANPLRDIHNTTAIEHVIRSGVVRDASTLERVRPRDAHANDGS